MPARKLSASALSTFLQSPAKSYWNNVARLEPITLSVANFSHDRICGTLWAEFVDRFYKGVSENTNLTQTLMDWHDQTDGWLPEKAKAKLTGALESWGAQYYQMFRPDDGCRNGSELHLENERFVAYLDGLSPERVVHEVKSTSRAPQLAEQILKVQTSTQVKLYCVMAKATGVCIEFAFKDPPYQVFRGPVVPVSAEQLVIWEQGLNALADCILSLGDDPNNYPCHPDGCTIITKNFVGHCEYSALCQGIEGADIAYKPRERRK